MVLTSLVRGVVNKSRLLAVDEQAAKKLRLDTNAKIKANFFILFNFSRKKQLFDKAVSFFLY